MHFLDVYVCQNACNLIYIGINNAVCLLEPSTTVSESKLVAMSHVNLPHSLSNAKTTASGAQLDENMKFKCRCLVDSKCKKSYFRNLKLRSIFVRLCPRTLNCFSHH